ncbi:chitobiase/beta-hexosaminidase C-terminal domain-containing protein, partial [Bacillus sp. JJ722]|uniref:chitobiase/beta-hexosaminidase C-terminal domain-containing protein n=1 Tax=Bacillus sp. JJ722 TaxID=3122973 RepID=UPI002FFE767B
MSKFEGEVKQKKGRKKGIGKVASAVLTASLLATLVPFNVLAYEGGADDLKQSKKVHFMNDGINDEQIWRVLENSNGEIFLFSNMSSPYGSNILSSVPYSESNLKKVSARYETDPSLLPFEKDSISRQLTDIDGVTLENTIPDANGDYFFALSKTELGNTRYFTSPDMYGLGNTLNDSQYASRSWDNRNMHYMRYVNDWVLRDSSLFSGVWNFRPAVKLDKSKIVAISSNKPLNAYPLNVGSVDDSDLFTLTFKDENLAPNFNVTVGGKPIGDTITIGEKGTLTLDYSGAKISDADRKSYLAMELTAKNGKRYFSRLKEITEDSGSVTVTGIDNKDSFGDEEYSVRVWLDSAAAAPTLMTTSNSATTPIEFTLNPIGNGGSTGGNGGNEGNNGGSTETPEVNKSDEKQLTSFSIDGMEAIINESNKSVTLTVPAYTELDFLNAEFTSSDKSTVSINGTEVTSGAAFFDYTNIVQVKVKAENGSSVTYFVKVKKDKPVENPIVENLYVDDVRLNGGVFGFESNTIGEFYYAVVPSDAEAPTIDDIVNQSVKGSLDKGKRMLTKGKNSFSSFGLESDTSYKVYGVSKMSNGSYSSLMEKEFKTEKPLALDSVDVNVKPDKNPDGTVNSTNSVIHLEGLGDDIEAYYTLDGSEPSKTNGTLYTQPIVITGMSLTEAHQNLRIKLYRGTEETSPSNVGGGDIEVTDTFENPELTGISVTDVKSKEAQVNFSANKDGEYTYVIYPSSSPAPSVSDILEQNQEVQAEKEEKDASKFSLRAMFSTVKGYFKASDSEPVLAAKGTGSIASGENNVAVNGLTPATDYTVYMVGEDEEGYRTSVTSETFTTSKETGTNGGGSTNGGESTNGGGSTNGGESTNGG